MPEHRATYELSAAQIAAYVQPLWQGALATPFDVRDEEGRRLSLTDDHLGGRHLLLVLLNDASEQQVLPALTALSRRQAELDRLGATVIAVCSSSDAQRNRDFKRRAGFSWPLAGDSTGAVFAAYGLHKEHGPAYRVVLVTPGGQVRCWFESPTPIDEAIGAIMQILENSRAAEEARWSPPHAPVLLVPNVLSPEECGQLVATFESGAPFMVRPPRPGEVTSSYQIPVYEHDRQDRVDLIIRDPAVLAFLDERIWTRVTPMIKKAFAFDVTRREELHIARYAGARGGIRMGHRDNTSAATGYRRFALTLNLNAGYEGGEIVFREYSPRGYRGDPGTAIVFSSSLLHEVEETRAGVRFALISHFFNEQSLAAK